MSLNSETIFSKAVERYYRDAERIGREVPPPSLAPDSSVDLRSQEVKLLVPDGQVIKYSFKLTKRGHLRFRPVWEN